MMDSFSNSFSKGPLGFLAFGTCIGLKEKGVLDFGVVHSEIPCAASAIFTRNNFPGAPVVVGRENIRNGLLQTVIVNSGVANVATGRKGEELVRDYCNIAGANLFINPHLILPSSTGVIGRPLPADLMKIACRNIKNQLSKSDMHGFSQAIMTTDTRPKLCEVELKSGIRISAMAKGAGMIQPDMATMLAYVFTDAKIKSEDLDRMMRSIADRTFNRVSIDGDTSTSDTLAALANGLSRVSVSFSPETEAAFNSLKDPFHPDALSTLPDIDEDSREFLSALLESSRELSRKIAREGEGASKLIELEIDEARDRMQALKIGRSLINSPLFKTAIHGADPNWGRIIMAIGKVYDEPVPLKNLRIFFGDRELKIGLNDESDLQAISKYLKNEDVRIRIVLGCGPSRETLWGCDLTEEYIRINAYYTT